MVEGAPDGTKNLVLRQNPLLMDLDEDEQKYPLVLAKNVRKFNVECWDTNKLEWLDEWENTNAIPTLLRVNLVLGTTASAADRNAPEFSVARLFSLPSQSMPAAAQNGQGAGPGGAPGGFGGPGGPRMVAPRPAPISGTPPGRR
jgi:hypothetical protein